MPTHLMLISWIIEIQSRVLDRKFINMTWHAMDTSYRPRTATHGQSGLHSPLVGIYWISILLSVPHYYYVLMTVQLWFGFLIYSMDRQQFHSCNILAIGIFSCRLYYERCAWEIIFRKLWFSHLVVCQSVVHGEVDMLLGIIWIEEIAIE